MRNANGIDVGVFSILVLNLAKLIHLIAHRQWSSPSMNSLNIQSHYA